MHDFNFNYYLFVLSYKFDFLQHLNLSIVIKLEVVPEEVISIKFL